MEIKDKGALIELIYKSLPYSEQITKLDLCSERDAVRFTWRGNGFRVTLDLFVEEIDGRIASGSDLAMVVERLLKIKSVQ